MQARGRSRCRARLHTPDGGVQEFQSTAVPRYARRTREVDDALLGCNFGGVNSRRIRTALKPLFGEAHFSKSAVSRVVAHASVDDSFLRIEAKSLHCGAHV